jgi:prepilin-type N-terminal cleavage/methylation domain-containing protein
VRADRPERADGRVDGGVDGGFTLVESIVSITLVSLVAAALTSYLTDSLRLLGHQVDRQTAGQLADDAIEQVRAFKAPQAGLPPTLPATTTDNVNGITYAETWTATACGRSTAANAPCDAVASGDVTYYRVVVTLSWRGACPGGSCSYQTYALLNTDADPMFNPQ